MLVDHCKNALWVEKREWNWVIQNEERLRMNAAMFN